MAQLIEESLLEAIKKDDIKAFDALMEKARCGTLRLGRFPVLSLMYLYNSRQILSVYEEKFIKIPNYEELREPVEVSKKFSAKAGKCLRLYLNEVVTPLEMLLILDKTKRLTRIYPLIKPSSAVKARLRTIYSIRYSLNVNFEGDQIILDRKPLSLRAKRNIAVICACSVFAVGIAVGVPVTVNAFKPVEGEVTSADQIDFGSQKEYTVKKDLVIEESVKQVNCKIIGNGHKVTVKNGASLGECNGRISDLTIESFGEALFTAVSEKAVIENVTVNVGVEIAATEGTALVAVTNYGVIDGVTVNVSGSINAIAPSVEGAAGFKFGGIVQSNAYKSQRVYGTIKNCKVNYSDFELVGERTADASFGGVAGINSGYLQDCTVTGKINADTFDIAGVCSVNNGVLSGNVNEADIFQKSDDEGWSPLISGIVLTNNSEVFNCANYGAITAEGMGAVYAGGIAAHSYSRIYNCFSDGDITVTAVNPYVGGILGSSEVAGENTITGLYVYFGTTDSCISESKIKVTATGEASACVGGIAGLVKEARVINGETVVYLGGCVTNCYFTGSCDAEVTYFGNIVGVCGANIYESNSYTSGLVQYHNFESNYYIDNSLKAFGATVATVDEVDNFTPVEDAGERATCATIEDIQNTEEYKAILKVLGK